MAALEESLETVLSPPPPRCVAGRQHLCTHPAPEGRRWCLHCLPLGKAFLWAPIGHLVNSPDTCRASFSDKKCRFSVYPCWLGPQG